MAKILKTIVLLFGALILLTGCQTKKSSTTERFSSSVTVSKNSTKSQSSIEKDSRMSSSKPETEELSATQYAEKRKVYTKGEINNNGFDNEIIFFKTSGSKESDEALKKFSETCQKVGKKLYTVELSTEQGKKILQNDEHISTPFSAIILKKDGILYLDLKKEDVPPVGLRAYLSD